MKKSEALHHWKQLPTGQDPLPEMQAIPYKTTGSRYGACGIRIDGSPEFIDAVLSNLKTLLAGENCYTRLELARTEVKPAMGRNFANATNNSQVCYVRLHERGGKGVHAAAYSPTLRNATLAFLDAKGVNTTADERAALAK